MRSVMASWDAWRISTKIGGLLPAVLVLLSHASPEMLAEKTEACEQIDVIDVNKLPELVNGSHGYEGFRLGGIPRKSRQLTCQTCPEFSERLGDVNNDGIDDFSVTWYENAFPRSGNRTTWVFLSNGSFPSRSVNLQAWKKWVLFQPRALPWPKRQLVLSPFPFGDINGDGINDVVTCEFADGMFAVVFGSVAEYRHINVEEVDGSNGFIIKGGHPYPIGDFNGDKFDDILVVGFDQSLTKLAEGAIYVVFGGKSQHVLAVNTLNGSTGFNITGVHSVHALGDINDDGFTDLGLDNLVLFGRRKPASHFSPTYTPSSLGAAFDTMNVSYSGTRYFKFSAAGDMNGDGINDLIVRSFCNPYPGPEPVPTPPPVNRECEATVLFGNRKFPQHVNCRNLEKGEGFTVIGVEMDSFGMGDFNRDGLDDMLVSSLSAGGYFVVFGRQGSSRTTMNMSCLRSSSGVQLSMKNYTEPSPLGDIHNDGSAALRLGNVVINRIPGSATSPPGATASPGLSTGAIAGIVCGSIIFIVILIAGFYIYRSKKRPPNNQDFAAGHYEELTMDTIPF
eukprot:gb/GECG01005209.1/.p1 GENE.gb/GECG01005209.1/~~gb/GECG01005209.1/.p1  ORF type:complete len:563 (+),score=35.06 gb/GECG01005209.1/:1-1689(+)